MGDVEIVGGGCIAPSGAQRYRRKPVMLGDKERLRRRPSAHHAPDSEELAIGDEQKSSV